MNKIFAAMVMLSFVFAFYGELHYQPPAAIDQATIDQAAEAAVEVSPMTALTQGVVSDAKSAVELALGLVGLMAFFLGLMKIAERGGLLASLASLLRPFLVRLFPDIPRGHPAMGSIIMNVSANMLGLGNAATPFGIKAMQELDSLNPSKGIATDSMILFLAINTSGVTLLPSGVIALRAAAGSVDPASILPTTLFATLCSTAVAILSAKIFLKASGAKADPSSSLPQKSYTALGWAHYGLVVFFLGLIPAMVIYGQLISPYMIPSLILLFVLYGLFKRVPVYEAMVEGAKDGFQVAIKIIPYMVTIFVGVGMLRNSGALQALIDPLSPLTSWLGLPGDALPMALLRPLSGSGAYGVLGSVIQDPSIGPDSYVGQLVSTLQGSTETTFYVIAVYYGAIQISKLRYTIPVCLLADLAGIIGAVVACQLFA